MSSTPRDADDAVTGAARVEDSTDPYRDAQGNISECVPPSVRGERTTIGTLSSHSWKKPPTWHLPSVCDGAPRLPDAVGQARPVRRLPTTRLLVLPVHNPLAGGGERCAGSDQVQPIRQRILIDISPSTPTHRQFALIEYVRGNTNEPVITHLMLTRRAPTTNPVRRRHHRHPLPARVQLGAQRRQQLSALRQRPHLGQRTRLQESPPL